MEATINKWKNTASDDIFFNEDKNLKNSKLLETFSNKISFNGNGIETNMGLGPSKINEKTVAAAALVYGEYLTKKCDSKVKPSVLIGHGNKENSLFYSEIIFKVLKTMGINAMLFKNNDPQSVPILSYATNKLNFSAGIMVDSPGDTKRINGIKFYDSEGSQLSDEVYKILSKKLREKDFLKVMYKDYKNQYISDRIVSMFINNVISFSDNSSNLPAKIVFSSQNGTTSNIIPALFKKMGIKSINDNENTKNKIDFKSTKSIDPANGKSFLNTLKIARKNKADAIITNNIDGTQTGVVVKHQKRYKFLNGNQIAAIYLEYKISLMPQNIHAKNDPYIIVSRTTGNLVKEIAIRNNMRIVEVESGLKNVKKIIANERGTFIFACEDSYACIVNEEMSGSADGISAATEYALMINYFKLKSISIYDKLKKIYSEYGIHRTTTFSKEMSIPSAHRLIKRLLKTKGQKVGENKIIDIINYNDGSNLIKIFFKNKSWVAVRYTPEDKKARFFVQTIGDINKKLIDIVPFEKEIENWIEDNNEIATEKKLSIKTLAKYFIFLGLTVGMFLIVFFTIYTGSQSVQGNTANSITTYTMAGMIFNSVNRWVWITMIIWNFVTGFISAWATKRSLMMQGQKAKLIDLFVAAVMSGIVAFLTPFMIGGDAVAYWYMRRRGIKRSALISSYMTDTLIGQAKYLLQSIILLSIGFKLYQQVFENPDPQAHAALVMFFVGVSWMVFSTFMIFVVLLNKRFQNFIVRNSVKLLEWTRFVIVTDPGKISSSFMFEFKMVRKGMSKIWKHKWYPIEMILYAIVPMFLNPMAIAMSTGGWINPNISSGTYLSQIIFNDIVGTANSMSITPGGSGTKEWLAINLNKMLFSNSAQINQVNTSVARTATASEVASGYDFMSKIFYEWPSLMFSMLLTTTMVFVENRRIRISRINKNLSLRKKELRKTTRSIKFVKLILFLFLLFNIIYHFFIIF